MLLVAAVDATNLITSLGSFGVWGLLLAYIIWRDTCDRRERKEQADARAKADEEDRKLYERDIEARDKHASAFTALAMVIQGRPLV